MLAYSALERIFLGTDTSWWFIGEILFRTIFMYLYTLANIRFMDKRSVGQLSAFEIIIVIALGSAVGDPMFMSTLPLVHGMIVITTVVLIEKCIATITGRNGRIDKLIAGSPVLIIAHGKILDDALKKEDLSREDLFSRLRQKGIANIAEVKCAFMETSGQISVLMYTDDQYEGESTYEHLINQRRSPST